MWVKPLAYVLADSRGFHRRRQNALKLAQLLEFRRAGQRKATQPWAQAAHAVETDTEGLHLDTVARLLRSAQQFVRYDPMVTQPVKRDVQMLRRYLTSGQATGVHPPLRRIDRH
ncbi:hypothetical protein SAMN05444748_11465 [Variovorax sp. OV700]|nr:hypothetical protein SAMN05444748_11465 [Variovorax sp. OV700]